MYKNYDQYYDIWSNIHYGYVGLGVGFDENTLLDGSDLQQVLHPGTRGADTLDDKTAMKIGFSLYKTFGKYADNLTYQDILNILDKKPIRGNFEDSKQVHWCFNSLNSNHLQTIKE